MAWKSKLAARRRPPTVDIRVVFNPTHGVLPSGVQIIPCHHNGSHLDSIKDVGSVACKFTQSSKGPGLWTLLWGPSNTPLELWKEVEEKPIEDGRSKAYKD